MRGILTEAPRTASPFPCHRPAGARYPAAVRPLALCLVALGTPAAAQTPDPDAFDPLLDRPVPTTPGKRWDPPKPGGPGFFIGGGGFLYAGRVRSLLTKRSSGLRYGAYPGVLVTLGGRARIPLEFGFDIGYGLGGRWNPEVEGYTWAHDLLLEPRLLWHVTEDETWDFAAGAAASCWLFDVGTDGLAETLFGPFGVLALRRHLDARSLLFLELSGGWGKDTLAYRTVDPTTEELFEDPSARPHRETGAWYPLFRLSAGYRLSGF